MTDPYDVLGAPDDADFETIRAAYRRLVRDNHPDVASDKTAATMRMAQINEAWRLLGAPEKKAAYDAQLKLRQIESEKAPIPDDQIRQEHQRRARLERERLAQAKARRSRSSRSTKTRETKTREVSKSKKSEKVPIEKAKSNKRNPSPRVSSKSKNPARDMRVLHKMTLATQLFHRDGRLEESAALCREVLRADGRNVPARELLGDILAHQGRTEIALMMFDQAIQIAPHDHMLRRKRDRLQLQQFKVAGPREAPRPPRLSLFGRLRAKLQIKR